MNEYRQQKPLFPFIAGKRRRVTRFAITRGLLLLYNFHRFYQTLVNWPSTNFTRPCELFTHNNTYYANTRGGRLRPQMGTFIYMLFGSCAAKVSLCLKHLQVHTKSYTWFPHRMQPLMHDQAQSLQSLLVHVADLTENSKEQDMDT
jgi:hypothetical protein